MKDPLTPSHFLIGRGTPMVSAEITDFSDNFANLREKKELQQQAIVQFWTEWQNEYIRYLPPLRLKKPNDDLKEGSMVLITDEGKPRLQWPLAIVTKLYPGRDGLIRAVDLRTA
ncbi:Pao retrotransposon peptidase superfamily [Elysia marginata]|uniref:Pao retrotransposon peptidase superfamily n=1 Tax=Elysia marginata TaxID=1093978 RepID=A0AAV4I824_9GAST|nr:Pao retrotransposon peptidase superfamily [Elysia marginata]